MLALREDIAPNCGELGNLCYKMQVFIKRLWVQNFVGTRFPVTIIVFQLPEVLRPPTLGIP